MMQEQTRALCEQAQTNPRDLWERVYIPGIGIRRVQVVFAPTFEPGFAWDIRVRDSEWRVFRSKIRERTVENFHEGARLLGYEELDTEGDKLLA
jgi:hypothetical protein